jgi:hypothetical protein
MLNCATSRTIPERLIFLQNQANAVYSRINSQYSSGSLLTLVL